MPLQKLIFVSQSVLLTLLDTFQRLPTPAAGALVIVVGICLYESLGNRRIAPGKWR